MKVVVDARLLRGGGIGRFTREITGPWLERDEVDEVTFLGDPAALEAWLDELPGRDRARIVPWRDTAYSPRAQLRVAGPVGRAIRRADVRFFPHYDAPVLGLRHPSVVVVHDLTQFQPGAPFPLHKRILGEQLLRSVVRRATRVVTVSRNSHRDLASRVPSAESSIRVVRPGVSETFRSAGRNGSDERYLWDSFRPFLLTVGEPRPHKRIDFAVDLLAELRREGREDLTLIAVGAPGGPGCPVRRRAVERGVSGSVVALGRVSDHTLKELYHNAEALLFPSLYEGFGLPVVEAAALGCPVIASDRASIPEAANGGAVLLDPFDLAGWKRAFLKMPRRNGNGHGNGEAAPASWAHTSRSVFAVLQEALAEERTVPSVGRAPTAPEPGLSPAKRTFDLSMAALGLVLAAPVLLACSLAVWLSSGRPILFGHTRCGLRGRTFQCLKFRTMVHDAEDILHQREDLRTHYLGNGYKLPRNGDPRVTRVGHFLRYTHLDELPQLVNVLLGDMSLIGPRPVIPPELDEYGEETETLLSVRPGIFGPWTALGKSRPSYPERAEVELSYARDPGFGRDAAILLRNIPVLLWGQTDE